MLIAIFLIIHIKNSFGYPARRGNRKYILSPNGTIICIVGRGNNRRGSGRNELWSFYLAFRLSASSKATSTGAFGGGVFPRKR